MIKSILFLLILNVTAYDFSGKHYCGDYILCHNIDDIEDLEGALLEACCKAGANVLECTTQRFSGGGCTICIVLEESHATIHTYPEYKSCFVDLFTCGTQCDYRKFEEALIDYLQPHFIRRRVLKRGT